MSDKERIIDIQRILVALDASQQSLAALEVAAELAAKYGAELIAVFVEDINLVRLSEFPFAQEIGYFSAISRQLDSQQIERELRAHARWVERTTATIAKRTNLRWSFRTTHRLQLEAQSLLEPAAIPVSYRWLSEMDGQKLARLARLEGC